MDDHGHQRVSCPKNFTTSYLQGGRMTKDTNGYLVLKFSRSCLRDGLTNKGYQWVQILSEIP